MVCGVHAQTHELPCGAAGVGVLGWLSSHDVIPAGFRSDLLYFITSLLSG